MWGHVQERKNGRGGGGTVSGGFLSISISGIFEVMVEVEELVALVEDGK